MIDIRKRPTFYMLHSIFRQRGQSLMEILVAVTVAGLIFMGIAALVYAGIVSGRASRENAFAQSLIVDMGSAVRGLSSQDWHSFWGSNGLVSYWAMDEATSTRIYEPVSGNNGTATTTVSWQTSANCKVGTCLSFDGSSQYADISSGASFNVSNISVSAWVWSGVTTAELTAVSRYDNVSPQNGNWLLGHGSSASTYRFLARIGGINYQAQSGTGFSTGAWNHIVGTYDGSVARLFVNGAERASSTISGSLAANTANVRIGNRVGNVNYWNGRIDEARIYNRALSQTEIQAMYNNPGKLYPQNLGGYWSMKEGTETKLGTGSANFLRWFTIDSVQRDSNDNITSTISTPDPSTVKVSYYVETPRRTISFSEYITRSETKVTVQTDWSGGAGEEGPIIQATTKFSTSSNIVSTTTGSIYLTAAATAGYLASAIFDTLNIGGAAYNYVLWQGSKPADTRVDFQFASSNSTAGPWTYVGDNCTTGTRYTNVLPNTVRRINAACHTGHRYFRYKVWLVSITGTATPIIDDIIIGWSP